MIKNNVNSFSVVIPTMWKNDNILKMLIEYQKSKYIKEIILIDNDPKNKLTINSYDKIKYFTTGENLFVNPSWNLGYSLSNYQLLLVNDDIIIENIDSILELISKTDYDIIGVKLGKKTSDMRISEISKFPSNHYGSFMYVKKYTYIPDQIKIWYGDNILFDNAKKRGIIENCGIVGNQSSTVKEFKNSDLKKILDDDKLKYESLISPFERFNIVIRTSGRPTFFKNCIKSIEEYYPTAKLHITIDKIEDLNYVKDLAKNFDFSYYIINKKTIEKICSKIKLNRDRPFIYNYYMNVVKPFIKGWCMYLDDDDMMIRTPEFNSKNKDVIHLSRVDRFNKIVPSYENFRKRVVLNDINTSCIIVHSDNLIDWIPNRGGDFDFINSLYSKYKTQWYDVINSTSQKGDNFGNRTDLHKNIINGFYLNLLKRTDRKEKMEIQLKSIRHNIVRYEALDGNEIKDLNGFVGSIKNSEHKQYATYLSHLGMLKTAKKNKWDKVIIFEDDITLCQDFDDRMDNLLNFLPEDWKIVYLGFNGQPSTNVTKINKWVYSVNNVYGCFGMMINGNFLDEFINIIESNKKVIDELIWSKILPKYKCYSFIPFLVYVNNDYSDLWNKNRELKQIKNLFLDNVEIHSDYLMNENYPFGIQKTYKKTDTKIVTVSTFWNAGEHVKNCIESIKNQEYKDFISYFIDDMSTDNSYEIAKKTIGNDKRFILIKNTEKKYKTKNFIDVIKNNSSINWDDIIVEIDGDDQLADSKVLKTIHGVFLDKNIWLCGTRWKDNYGRLGNYGKPIPERARSTVWNFSHMRSFRAFLFREIKDEHLKMNGEYFKGACDIGHAIPMLEMSGSEHFYYINEPLYIYTWHNNQSYSENGGIGDKTTQSKTGSYIYSLPKYNKLKISDSFFENYERRIYLEELKDRQTKTLDKLGFSLKPQKKAIDYNNINSITSKKGVYQPKEQIKPIRQNKPNKRQELIELKKESVSKQVKLMYPGKPNRRNGLPNIF